jgi:hypothetical protein
MAGIDALTVACERVLDQLLRGDEHFFACVRGHGLESRQLRSNPGEALVVVVLSLAHRYMIGAKQGGAARSSQKSLSELTS